MEMTKRDEVIRSCKSSINSLLEQSELVKSDIERAYIIKKAKDLAEHLEGLKESWTENIELWLQCMDEAVDLGFSGEDKYKAAMELYQVKAFVKQNPNWFEFSPNILER